MNVRLLSREGASRPGWHTSPEWGPRRDGTTGERGDGASTQRIVGHADCSSTRRDSGRGEGRVRAVMFWCLILVGSGGMSLALGGLLRGYNDVLGGGAVLAAAAYAAAIAVHR
jgi:hypothetical protein